MVFYLKEQAGMEGQLVSQYMAEKAGMKQVDKKTIAQTIQKLTAGSPKTLHEKEMQEKRAVEVAEMLRKCLNFSGEQKEQMKRDWWIEINQMRQKRELGHYWAHFDFDMFYVACQLLDKPELRDKPCAVGGRNSVLSTANYEARKYGLRAAMPTFIALQLCPHVVLFDPNFSKYKHYSDIFRGILSTYDSDLESHGLDEAYINLSGQLSGKSVSEIQEYLQQIRTQIFEATGLTVSCGVGANKMLAKMASEERKPNNQFVLENEGKAIEAFMAGKPIRKIPGIGPVQEFYLKGLGIESAKDILENVDVLTICYSRSTTEFFVSTALGLGSIEHQFKERKSVGKSETFKATEDQQFLEARLRDLCEQVSMELQELGLLSSNVVFSYQTNSFEKRDKTFNLPKYTDQHSALFQTTGAFLKSNKFKLRLLGVRCSSLMRVEDYKKQQLVNYLSNPKKVREAQEGETNSAEHIKSLMRSEVVEVGKYVCPICSEPIDCKGNITMFNKHVDKCLMGGEGEGPSVEPEAEVKSTGSRATKKTRPVKKKQGQTMDLSAFLKKKE